MAQSKLKIDVRRNKILERLRTDGRVSVTQLSEDMGATPVTIRNDLAALERDGYLIRMQGGAVLSRRMQGSFLPGGDREDKDYMQKQAVAAEVAKMIRDGNTIFFNSGTTTYYVARALQGKKNLNIVTNSLAVAMELGNISTCSVLLLGGQINARYGFTYGGDTQDQLSRYQADWVILSVDGVSARGGVTTYHAEEAIIDRLMMANARKRLVAATGSKIGNAGFSRICECNEDMCLITSSDCDKEALQQLHEKNVQVIQV